MTHGKKTVNDGVSCTVSHCVFNCGERRCSAPVVSVGEEKAVTEAETRCATFRSRTGCEEG
ncbi:MAG: DUF1540 domain-containing protein [Clostridia bacterium]|nr:DUF1540 domain-containing protein [Clostridia bacterium]MBR5742992.1 DUF1540 domain-containing protein [Clostridia bacterium]